MISNKTYTTFINTLSEREKALIDNCIVYSENNPSGLPGHNLMLIVEKLYNFIIINTDLESDNGND